MASKRAKNVTWAIKQLLDPAQVKLFDEAPSISDPGWIDAFSRLLWVEYSTHLQGMRNAKSAPEMATHSKRCKYIEEELRKLKYLHDITLNAINTPNKLEISFADPAPTSPEEPNGEPHN